MGWVLPYSSENQRVADEAVRVAKPGGIVAIGCPGNREMKKIAQEIYEMEKRGVGSSSSSSGNAQSVLKKKEEKVTPSPSPEKKVKQVKPKLKKARLGIVTL